MTKRPFSFTSLALPKHYAVDGELIFTEFKKGFSCIAGAMLIVDYTIYTLYFGLTFRKTRTVLSYLKLKNIYEMENYML